MPPAAPTSKPEFPWWLAAALALALAAALAIASSDLYAEVFATVAKGIGITVFVTAVAFALASVLGLGIALMALSRSQWLRQIARFYVEIIRGVPILVLLFWIAFAGAPAFVHSHNLGLMMMAWGADWPTGYGFLDQIVDGASIKASGNSNLSELNDPKVNNLLSSAIQNTNAAQRVAAWGQVDKQVMADAAIVPLVYRLDLLYRPPAATNVTVTPAYGMYDYLNIGTK